MTWVMKVLNDRFFWGVGGGGGGVEGGGAIPRFLATKYHRKLK